MIEEFQKHTTQQLPFLEKGKLLLAISGGLDSVVLTHLCKNANFNFSLAHCNFNLREKESDEDEIFVKNLAEELGVEVFTQHFQTQKFAEDAKVSIQLAARKLRYAWFEEVAEEHHFNFILTAHHLNDSLETYIINTSRGTGIKGLTGIPEVNDKIVRPLLNFSRDEILFYAEENQLTWREDSSNASDKYLRNKIRHHVIPVLEEEQSSLLKNFQQTQLHLKDTADLLEDYTTILFSKIVKEINGDYYFNIKEIKETPHPKAVLYQLLNSFGFTEWEDIYRLLEAQTGKHIFSKTHRLVKDREVLILRKIDSGSKSEFFQMKKGDKTVKFPIGELSIHEVENLGNLTKSYAYLAAEKLKYPLILRKWKAGDYFQPFGMKGKKKKMSDFLKDEKLSPLEKENTWVLVSDQKIAWVVGHRIDNRFKIEPNTTTKLKLTLQK